MVPGSWKGQPTGPGVSRNDSLTRWEGQGDSTAHFRGPNHLWQSSSQLPHVGSHLAPRPRWGALGMVSNHSGPQFPHRQNGDNHKGLLGGLNEVIRAKLMAVVIGLGL